MRATMEFLHMLWGNEQLLARALETLGQSVCLASLSLFWAFSFIHAMQILRIRSQRTKWCVLFIALNLLAPFVYYFFVYRRLGARSKRIYTVRELKQKEMRLER